MKSLSVARLILMASLSCRAVASNLTTDEERSMCDESKCRANRTHPWVDGDTEYTCWIPLETTNVTDLCADDYVGRFIPNAPTMKSGQVQLQWYTCCRPDYSGELTQQCSDVACSSPDWEGGGNCWADGFQEPMSCSREYRYPRSTGMISLIYVQYVCCTTPTSHWFMQELLVARIIWMMLSGITFLACSIFIASIVSSKKVRSQGYNLYLLFLAIPDAIANLFIVIRNSLTITGAPVSPTIHILLASFEYFYAAANMWLNGVIVSQIHFVLRKSNRCVRIAPPSVQRVCRQAITIYLFASLWFAWSFFLYYRGLVMFDLAHVVPIWIATRVLMVAPPLFYVIYVCVDVKHNKLLPKSGRTRVLSLYFLRVIIVFVATWVPYFILYEIAWNVTHSRWMVYVSYYLGSIQGFLSVIVALSKPDIKRAFVKLICCGRLHEEQLESVFKSWAKAATSTQSQARRINFSANDTTTEQSSTNFQPNVAAPVVVADTQDDAVNESNIAKEHVDEEAVIVEEDEETSDDARVVTNQPNGRRNKRQSLLGSTIIGSANRRPSMWETEDVWEPDKNKSWIDQLRESGSVDNENQEETSADDSPRDDDGESQTSPVTGEEP